MRRFLLPLALLVLAALALGACDSQFSATAAKVDGAALSQQSLNEALGATASDAAFRCIVQASSGSPSISGVGTGTYSSAYTAQVLTTLVDRQVLHTAVAPLHLPTGPVAGPLASEVLGDVYAAPSGSSCASGPSAIAALGHPFRTDLLSYQEDQDALIAHEQGADLTTAGLAAYVRSHPQAGTLDCVGAILASTKAASLKLAAKIAHGASFASVAKSSSLDTTSGANGGSLGCLLPSELPAALASVVTALPLGKVSAPVSYSGYWVLLRVTSRPHASALRDRVLDRVERVLEVPAGAEHDRGQGARRGGPGVRHVDEALGRLAGDAAERSGRQAAREPGLRDAVHRGGRRGRLADPRPERGR